MLMIKIIQNLNLSFKKMNKNNKQDYIVLSLRNNIQNNKSKKIWFKNFQKKRFKAQLILYIQVDLNYKLMTNRHHFCKSLQIKLDKCRK